MSDARVKTATGAVVDNLKRYGHKSNRQPMPVSAGHSRAVRKVGEFELFIKGASKRRRYTKWT